jgi:hypothetical protein
MRDIIAVLAGWITGMVANMLFTMFNLAMYPMPEGVVFGDNQDFSSYLESLPVFAFLIILVAHLSQAFFGGLIAATISRKRPVTVAMIIGILSLIGGLLNIQSISLPTWMWIEVPLYPIVAFLSAKIILSFEKTYQ